MTKLLCIVLVQFHTGYGVYNKGVQIECVYDKPDIDGLHWVDCSESMAKLRLAENEFINNPKQWVRISKRNMEYGKECFYVD